MEAFPEDIFRLLSFTGSQKLLNVFMFYKNLQVVTSSKAILKKKGIGSCDKYRTAVSFCLFRGLIFLPSLPTPVKLPWQANPICDIMFLISIESFSICFKYESSDSVTPFIINGRSGFLYIAFERRELMSA